MSASTNTALARPAAPVDLEAAYAEAVAFAGAHPFAASTLKGQRKHWRIWRQLCEESGWDPLDAPFDAFKAVLTFRRSDGRLPYTGYVASIVCSVARVYEEHGKQPPHRLPENAGIWRDLVRGHRRAAAAAGPKPKMAVRESPRDAVPLLRPQVLAMLAAEPQWPSRALRRRAASLLVLDGLAPVSKIRTLTVDDVVDTGTEITVAGVEVPCDHRQRIHGVPWDCTACAVREVTAISDPGEELFALGAADFAPTWLVLRRRIRGIGAENATDWQAAGVRRAVSLYSFRDLEERPGSQHAGYGLRWIRARAWVAVAWTCGLRMASDATGIKRGQVRPADDGSGWSVALGATKDDPHALKGEVRFFPWPQRGETGVTPFLVEYLCVRDAYAGGNPDGAFIIDMHKSHWDGPLVKPVPVATRDLNLLAGLAGLDPVYSSYSTRKGYVAQGIADGMDVEDIQAGLRHKSLETTLRHYVPGVDSKRTAKKAAAAFAEAGAV